jgi:hypothetical protein
VEPAAAVRPRRVVRWLVLLAIGLPVFVLCAAFVWTVIVPWAHVWCDRQEIDIATGRTRSTRFFFGLVTSEHVRDSYVTKVLGEARVKAALPVWETVNVFSAPGVRYSPHFAFHGAFGQLKELEALCALCKERCSEAARVRAAEALLECWRDGSDGVAHVYLASLADTVLAEGNEPAFGVGDVEKALAEARREAEAPR